MVAMVERLANINSGSLNRNGLSEVASILSRELTTLGFTISSLPGRVIEMPSCPGSNLVLDLSDHVLARRAGLASGTRLLLMGHMDTVFPPESPFQTARQQGENLAGPGVSDMKGGLVVMLYALRALNEEGLLDGQAISVLLNSDEEVGSLSSRSYIETQAGQHDYGLVFEPSGGNTMIRGRKGLGQARMVVNGRASHSGAAHEDGRSAIRELAYKIIELENMTDYETGVTVNVGIVNGGEARNTVSPCAEAYVDLRYPEPEQGTTAEQQFQEISDTIYSYPGSDELSAETWVQLHRPPKIPTEESDHLLNRTIAIGKLLGQEFNISDSGGGTDGSLSQAAGLPTLDSLGVSGSGNHSDREQANVSSLVERAKLSAILIKRLLEE